MNIIDYGLTFDNVKHDNTPEYIIIHHDIWPGATMEDIHKDHKYNNGWDGVGYHYRVRLDGTVEKGRPDYYHGAHCKEDKMNFKSLGIVFEGCYTDYTTKSGKTLTMKKMPEIQFIKGVELILEKMNEYNIPSQNIRPHRYYATYKDCPGKYFPMVDLLAEIMKRKDHWADRYMQWLKDTNLIDSYHSPEDNITWAEFATVLYRLYMEVKNNG